MLHALLGHLLSHFGEPRRLRLARRGRKTTARSADTESPPAQPHGSSRGNASDAGMVHLDKDSRRETRGEVAKSKRETVKSAFPTSAYSFLFPSVFFAARLE